MKRFASIILMLFICFEALTQPGESNDWTLVLKQPGLPDQVVSKIPNSIQKMITIRRRLNGVDIELVLVPGKSYTVFKAVATSNITATPLFFSLAKNYSKAVPYNFNGEVVKTEIYRQSPHDVNAWIVHDIAMQSVPVVALKEKNGFEVALCGSPYLYDNYTSQSFDTKRKRIELSSGDNGEAPGLHPDSTSKMNFAYNKEKTQIFTDGKILSYYPIVSNQHRHSFEGIIFNTSKQELKGLRMEINGKIASYFSHDKYRDYFGSLAFSTAFMNLRKNETGKSRFWVVPSVEYANTQYGRDAFWMSMMLPDSMALYCLDNELDSVNQYAEYPLFTILWAFSMFKKNLPVDRVRVQKYIDAVIRRSRDGYYYSYDENDGRQDFQYWGDIIAFDKDDVVTYNQGLFALALLAAKEMDLRLDLDPDKPIRLYRQLYNKEGGFYPISKKKNNILGPDPILPDLLAILYFGRPLLPDQGIRNHYQKMSQLLKTKFGFKVVGRPNGNYLKNAEYDVDGYVSQVNIGNFTDGQYFRGGSFFLYDNIFLIDAYLHGIKKAEDDLIWRASLDFKIGATTYECINTINGEAWKPNMGWNVAVYAIWRNLVDQGKASGKLFNEINRITGYRP